MSETRALDRVLALPILHRTRRNHAIEHATVHILSGRRPGLPMAGHADAGGFFLLGRLETEEVHAAAREAIERLRREPGLAVHPNCGTNLVVGGVLAGLASMAALATLPPQRSRSLDALSRLVLAGTAAALASQPLGPWVQRHLTTSPETGGARVGPITRRERAGRVLHRIAIVDEAP